jgi:signal transduction histidine kinase/CheY-like chemotaxis protein
MSSQDYPQNYLNQAHPNITSLDNDFANWVLETRVWVIRVIIAGAATITVWRLGSGLPVYSASVLLSLLVNSVAVLGLLSTIPWNKSFLLNFFQVRLLVCVLLLVCAYHMISTSGIAPMWTLALMAIGVVIQLDEPSDDRLSRRWLGSIIVITAVLASLGLIPSSEEAQDIEQFNRWIMIFCIVISVTVYAWHQLFYFQKYLSQSGARDQTWWKNKVSDVLSRFEFTNPFLVLLVLVVVVIASVISALFVSWDSSIIASLGRLHTPLLVGILGVMLTAFLLAVNSASNRWLSKVFFLFLSLIFAWAMAHASGIEITLLFMPFVVLQFFQPPRFRWLALGVTVFSIMLYLNWHLDDLVSSEALVIGVVNLICCVFIFDHLRQCHLKQLAVLKSLSTHIPSVSEDSVLLSENASQPWFENIKHWYLMALTIGVVFASVGYYTFQFNHRIFAEELTKDLKNKVQIEQGRLYSDMQLVALAAENNPLAANILFSDFWCSVSLEDDNYLLQAQENNCLPSFSNTTLTLIESMPLGGLMVIHDQDKAVLVIKAQMANDQTVIAQLDLNRWLRQTVLPERIHSDFDAFLNIEDIASTRLGQYDFSAQEIRFDSGNNAVEIAGETLSFEFVLKPQALQYFGFGLLQVLIIAMLIMILLRHFYSSRSNYIRVSTALEQSEKALDVDRELRQELANALHRAEDANRAKDQFLGVIGHEIRTPLNSVMGMLQALSLQSLPDSAKQLVRSAYSGSHMLLNLVNDVLDFAKIQSGTMSLYQRPFAIGHLVNLYYQQYLPSATAKGLTFKCQFKGDKEAILVGDEVRIGQILANLLSNAIKFTSVGGVIFQVDVVGNDQSKQCIFRIIDTGPGIEKKHQRELFEPFVQLDMSIKREHRGAGLGLSIAKRLAELMAGRIDVSSRIGKGSTFSYVVELNVSEDISLKPTITDFDFEPPEAIYRGVRILVVDDDELNLDVIRELLEPYGVEVDCAQTAQQALAYVTQVGKDYAFILMDHQMPDMTGLEQTYRIRETFTKSDLPIVILTADLSDKVQQLSVKAGSNEAIAKPVKLKTLLRLLEHYRH